MSTSASPDALRRAYEAGYAAALRGEEAAPGCTVTAEGREWLRGYVAGAGQSRQPSIGSRSAPGR